MYRERHIHTNSSSSEVVGHESITAPNDITQPPSTCIQRYCFINSPFILKYFTGDTSI